MVKKNNQVGEVEERNPDESFTKKSMYNIRKIVKAPMKSIDRAFVKMMRKRTDEISCEAISPRISSHSRSGHIISSDATTSSQAKQDSDVISKTFEPNEDIEEKLWQKKVYSHITSPAFDDKKREMQMKKHKIQIKKYCSKKALVKPFRLFRHEKHTSPRIASSTEPQSPRTAYYGQFVEQMGVSPNSCSQLSENAILRTVTITVEVYYSRRDNLFEVLIKALLYVVGRLLKKMPKISLKMVLRGLCQMK